MLSCLKTREFYYLAWDSFSENIKNYGSSYRGLSGGHSKKLKTKILDLVLHIDPSSVQQYRHQLSIYVSHCFLKRQDKYYNAQVY